ncbi:MAG: UDP-glucose 4-epimerase GalE [Deltaproteobacteria bacterium]|nr:UDP-glucose 4-epimerase GalE [Deltaproteobacteria bacterium]
MATRVLVVGGAGYIGSHCARALAEDGFEVVTFDDLSTGHAEAVTGPLVVGDIRDGAALRRVLRAHRPDAVMHFAAKALVGESVARPSLYFDVNVGGSAALIAAMLDEGVRRLVFSSTCAVFGDPERCPLDESQARRPLSPYGESKLMVEQIIERARAHEGLQAGVLRYFNAAGAALDARLGEAHSPETHLIPLAVAAARGERPPLQLFGTDYPTRDGTCVRDYVHVLDLASAHLACLQRLLDGDRGDAWNLGTGRGTSNREVLDAVGRAVGTPVPVVEGPRRVGDPAELWADPRLAMSELGWQPQYANIDAIVSTAARWAAAPRF